MESFEKTEDLSPPVSKLGVKLMLLSSCTSISAFLKQVKERKLRIVV